ncbi:MAG: phosphomannomutase/phosphoglucomutase [Burkholderiales bacterium]|jgi:phosphomannomutase/phosphoglucomutase|nr:phosphomannomutase/phosphoglucomutase [Burkholderiales bacterium]
MSNISSVIFKAYDIRGIVDVTLTTDAVRAIGQALAALALARQCDTIVCGRDGRLSGERFSTALIDGITAMGVNVVDIGMVTTPMVYFAAHHLETRCGVMVTGSHNPPQYNGLKMVIGGETLSGETIQSLRKCIERDDIHTAVTRGNILQYDIAPAYFDRIAADIHLARSLKIIVDAGNGVAGAFAPTLYRRLGCVVEPLFCDVDGSFPNHHPDPSHPDNLQILISRLKNGDAELGLAFDGDGDRLGVVTPYGNIIYPDRQLMLFATDLLERAPNATIIYDIKSTRLLAPWIRAHGGVPLMWKTGHSLIKAKMKETGALLAGEMSGHLFFGERWYGFDDGVYAGARLLEILSRHDNAATTLDALPNSLATPELTIPCTRENEQHEIVACLQREMRFPSAREVIHIDGVRVEYDDGFGLARASNTTPAIVLRFEADSQEVLIRIRNEFKTQILRVAPDISFPS